MTTNQIRRPGQERKKRARKASKKKAKARVLLYAPSGAGKTYTSLEFAEGMREGGLVYVIDSERGTSEKYADRFDFEIIELGDRDVADYLDALEEAKAEGAAVVVVDSISHAWMEALEEVDRQAGGYGGNKWGGWAKVTPEVRKLLDEIVTFPGHVIVTARAKTAWDQEEGDNGKKKPVRIGLAPEFRGGIEYEFDFVMSLDVGHVGHVDKDRSGGGWQDERLIKPGRALASALVEWLQNGETPMATRAQASEIWRVLDSEGVKDHDERMAIVDCVVGRRIGALSELTAIEADHVCGYVRIKGLPEGYLEAAAVRRDEREQAAEEAHEGLDADEEAAEREWQERQRQAEEEAERAFAGMGPDAGNDGPPPSFGGASGEGESTDGDGETDASQEGAKASAPPTTPPSEEPAPTEEPIRPEQERKIVKLLGQLNVPPIADARRKVIQAAAELRRPVRLDQLTWAQAEAAIANLEAELDKRSKKATA